jgi:hypothetical protein
LNHVVSLHIASTPVQYTETDQRIVSGTDPSLNLDLTEENANDIRPSDVGTDVLYR